jgi:hypothetical protein
MVGPPFSDMILLEVNMSADTNQSSQNLLGTLARLCWMLFGNLTQRFAARSANFIFLLSLSGFFGIAILKKFIL